MVQARAHGITTLMLNLEANIFDVDLKPFELFVFCQGLDMTFYIYTVDCLGVWKFDLGVEFSVLSPQSQRVRSSSSSSSIDRA